MDAQKRTWAEIDLGSLAHNYKTIKARLGGTGVMAIVKADAYGHGSVQTAHTLESLGCSYFATATVDEAAELRAAGISSPIAVLGRTPPEYTDELLSNDLTQSVSTLEDAVEYSKAAEKLGRKLRVHIKLDTGMGRLGFAADDLKSAAKAMVLPGLYAEGAFSHFAVADAPDDEYTLGQIRSFNDCIKTLENLSGQRFKILHCAASSGMLNYEKAHFDLVRPGIALYGIRPDAACADWGLRPVMSLKTRISLLRTIKKGESVSYGRTYVAEEDRLVAVLPIGYADGLHRLLSNKAEFSVRGQRIRQIGNICMDMCMADVTDVPGISVGDEVTVFGAEPSVCELSGKAGTIPYELMCAVSPRVPRVYKNSKL